MNESEIKDRLEEIRQLADDDLLWPIAATESKRREIDQLRRDALGAGATALASKAKQLLVDLDKRIRDPETSKGQALAAFLDAKTREKLHRELQNSPYLQTVEAAQRLEQMAVRGMKTGTPLRIMASCWQRGAFARIVLDAHSPEAKTELNSIVETAGQLKLEAGQPMAPYGEFMRVLNNLGAKRVKEKEWEGAELALKTSAYFSEIFLSAKRKTSQKEVIEYYEVFYARVTYNLGEIRYKMGNWKKAFESYEASAYHFKMLFQYDSKKEYKNEYASSLHELGKAQANIMNLKKGAEYLRAAVHYRSQLFGEMKTGRHLAALSDSLFQLGRVHYAQRKISAAMENFAGVLNLTEMIPDSSWPGTAPVYGEKEVVSAWSDGHHRYEFVHWGSLYFLAQCHLRRSEAEDEPTEKHLREARFYIEKAVRELEERRRELGSYEARKALRRKWNKLYETLRKVALRQGDLEAALRWTAGPKARLTAELIGTGRRRAQEGEADRALTEDLDTLEIPEAWALARQMEAVAEVRSERPLWISFGLLGRDQLVVFAVALWETEAEGFPIWAEEIRLPDDAVRRMVVAFHQAKRLGRLVQEEPLEGPLDEEMRRAFRALGEEDGIENVPGRPSAVEAGFYQSEVAEEEEKDGNADGSPAADGYEEPSEPAKTETGDQTVEKELHFGSGMGRSGEDWTPATRRLEESEEGLRFDRRSADEPPWWTAALARKKAEVAWAAQEAGLDPEEWDVAPAAWPPVPEERPGANHKSAKEKSSGEDGPGGLGYAREGAMQKAAGGKKEGEGPGLREKRREFLRMQRIALMRWARREVGRKLVQPGIDAVAERLSEGEGPTQDGPTEVLLGPDGALHGLPLETGPAHWPFGEEDGKAPLIEQVPAKRVSAPLLAPLLAEKERGEESQADDAAPRGRALVAGPPDRSDLAFDPEATLKDLRSALGSGQVAHLQEEKMRKETLLDRLGREETAPEVLHFATHGVFEEADPLASHLKCYGEETLTAREVLAGHIDLGETRLLYLASCEGTYGEGAAGDVMGLVYALLAAGASCVVGHLYPVNWEVARKQSAAFYEAFGEGAPAGAAYREATKAGREYCEGGGAPEAAAEDWPGLVLFGDPSVSLRNL